MSNSDDRDVVTGPVHPVVGGDARCASVARSHTRLVPQKTMTRSNELAIEATTLSLSIRCTARKRWYIVPTVSVGWSIETSIGSLR